MRALGRRAPFGPALAYGRPDPEDPEGQLVGLCRETLSQMDRRDPIASGLLETVPASTRETAWPPR